MRNARPSPLRHAASPQDGGTSLEASPSCHWTLIVEPEGADGATNMATDDALLRSADRDHAFLRIYRWTPACLSFGRHEPARRRYDRQKIESQGLDVVRRPTGGRAVWHDTEVTYAVAAPTAVFGSLRAAYIRIHTLLAAALQSLGAPVSVAGPRRMLPPNAGACFAAPVGGEIICNERKLVGSAQYREPGVFLQHGSILLENTQEVVRGVSRDAYAPIPATSLREIVHRAVTFDDVAQAVAGVAHRHWSGPWSEGRDLRTPIDVDRFRDPAWTWYR